MGMGLGSDNMDEWYADEYLDVDWGDGDDEVEELELVIQALFTILNKKCYACELPHELYQALKAYIEPKHRLTTDYNGRKGLVLAGRIILCEKS